MRRPDVAVVVVIFTVSESVGSSHPGRLQVLLIERSAAPEEGKWAAPGGALQPGESLDRAAVRKLEEETGVTDLFLEQLYTFNDLDPSPADGSVAVASFALVRHDQVRLATRPAWRPAWFPLDALPPLAFRNEEVINTARQRLISKTEVMSAIFTEYRNEKRNGAKFGNVTIYLLIVKSALCS